MNRISGRPKRCNSTTPTADSLDELAERWAEYGELKFAASAREASRSRIPMPPASTRCDDIPTREEIRSHLQALSQNKAPGMSGLPVEAYLAGSHSVEDLIDLVQAIFKHEQVPEDMVVGEFVML